MEETKIPPLSSNNAIAKIIYEKLKAAFPIDAYVVDNSRGFPLTSLTAQWIKTRLNEVFGVFGWEFEEKFVEKQTKEGKFVVICHGCLTIRTPYELRKVYATGGCEEREGKGQNFSDIYKSAATESLSKASSFIGIGEEMYKGNIDPKIISLERGDFNKASNAVKASKNSEELQIIEARIQQRKWETNEVEDLNNLIQEKYKSVKTIKGEK